MATKLELYVSPSGDDRADGRAPGSPLFSIHRARDIVRAALREKSDQDVAVYLRSGSYFLEDPLELDERDSPAEGFKVEYRNHKSEVPIIHGGRAVADWEHWHEGVYRAPVAPGTHCGVLTENGVPAIMARYPKNDYLRVQRTVATAPKRRFGFAPGTIPDDESASSLNIVLWPGGSGGEFNWHNVLLPVAEVDRERNEIELPVDCWYELGPGSRYYFQNLLSALTDPGEFAVDPVEGFIYYKPRESGISQQMIVAGAIRRVFSIVGSSQSRPAARVNLRGLHLACSDGFSRIENERDNQEDGAVYLENAQDVAVTDCRFENIGANAVSMNGSVKRVTVSNCLMDSIGHTGVRVLGRWHSTENVSYGHRIENNLIRYVGRQAGHGAGVQLFLAGYCEVIHNRIHHSRRYAVSMKGPASILREEVGGVPVTRDNFRDYTHTRNNLIAYNDVSHCNLDSQDTGVIESWGSGPNNTIHANHVHDSDVAFSYGCAIYLDDVTDGMTVSENLVDHMNKNGKGALHAALTVKGVGNRIRDNVIADNAIHEDGGNWPVIQTSEMNRLSLNRELAVERTLCFNTGRTLYKHSNWTEDRLASSEAQLLFNSGGSIGVAIEGTDSRRMSLADWRASFGGRFDQFTLETEPRFMDAPAGDYRLRYDSPAHGLGFTQPEYDRMGLRADFPFSEPEDPAERLALRVNGRWSVSWIDLETAGNERAHLEVFLRTVSGYLLPVPKQARLHFESQDRRVADARPDGRVYAREAGLTRVKVSAQLPTGDELGADIDVLVNDRPQELEIVVPDAALEVGVGTPVRVRLHTRYGKVRDVSKLATLNPPPQGCDVCENVIVPRTPGSLRLSARAAIAGDLYSVERSVEVRERIVRRIELIPNPHVVRVSETSRLGLVGYSKNGRSYELDLPKRPEIERPEVIAIDDDGLAVARSEGISKVRVEMTQDSSTLSAEATLTTYDGEAPEGAWKLSNMGQSEGAAYLARERLCLVGTGANAWFHADDITYLYHPLPEHSAAPAEQAVLRAELTVHSLAGTDPRAHVGVMLRGELDPRAANLFLRLGLGGRVTLSSRPEFDAHTDSVGNVQSGFPVRLRLDYRPGDARAYCFTEGRWILVAETTRQIDSGEQRAPAPVGRPLAGIAIFAAHPSFPARAETEGFSLSWVVPEDRQAPGEK